MAHSLFDGLNVGSLDGQQTALAVQSLLDSQTTAEVPQDDGDIFQCGRCKRQFTLLADFISHKEKCPAKVSKVPANQTASAGSAGSSQSTLPQVLNAQNVSSGTTVYSGGLGQSLVLSEEEFASLTTIDNPNLNLQAQQINITFQGGNPVLSQISGLNNNQTASVSCSPSVTATTNSAFNSTITSGPMHEEQEVEVSHVIMAEDVSEVPSAVEQPPLTVQVSSAKEVMNSGGSAAMVTPATAVIDGAAVEGLTLGTLTQSGLFQQFQIAGNQTRPFVLAHGLSSPAAHVAPGISILKPTTSKAATSIKKEGYTILQTQPQDQQYISVEAMEAQPTTSPKAKGRGKIPKTATSSEEGGKKKLRCTYCDKPFAKNFDLQQHIRSHTGEKPFQCIVCGRAFAQKSNVKKHMQTHKVWPKSSSTLSDSILYIQDSNDATDKDPVEKPATPAPAETEASSSKSCDPPQSIDCSYNCQYCPMKFQNYFKLKSHMIIHKSEQVYKCIHEKCSRTFKDLDQYLEHTKTHEHDMQYVCHICNKKFPTLYDLGVHQYSHSLYPNQGAKPSPKYYKCCLCGNKYTSTAALKHHIESTDHKYPCPKCGKVFQCERALRRHITTHNESLEYVCEICDKGFKTAQYLKLHMQNHNKDTPYQCEVCGTAFNRKDKLKRHRIIHEPTKKYKCPFRNHTGCDKAFNRADKLKAHIISHSGIKPFKCRYCGKSFSRRPHLNEHIRVHEGNYRFHCAKCKKGYNRRNLFHLHNCEREGQGDSNYDDREEDTPEKNTEVKVKKQGGKKIKRKPGRPRKMLVMNPGDIKKKRSVGRPRKNILPHPEKSASATGNVITISTGADRTNGGGPNNLIAVETPVIRQDWTLPIDEYAGPYRVVGEQNSNGENVVHVQLVTDPRGPMLAHDLDQHSDSPSQPLPLVELKQDGKTDCGVSLVSSLTQEQLQDILLTGNTHNVKLMDGGNGETFVIDEGSHQILTHFTESQGVVSKPTSRESMYSVVSESITADNTMATDSIATASSVDTIETDSTGTRMRQDPKSRIAKGEGDSVKCKAETVENV